MGGHVVAISLGALAAALFFAFAVCLILLIRRGREADRLHDQIMRFLNGEDKEPRFSVRDNRFALFENAVTELETRLLQSEENKRFEQSQNARLIVDISHQLKTPIAALKLYCELDDAEHRAQTLMLIERMERLIESLLRLEKLRAGGYEFHFQMADLPSVAREALDRIAPLFPARDIQISGNASLYCDAHWLGEAFLNLIKNACEHTRDAGRIDISFEQAEDTVLCVFQDDGGGVLKEELPRLFGRFFRSSASSSVEGVGVGLAIVRAIIERHHGTVCAENARGGLRITLCLPVLHHRLKKT